MESTRSIECELRVRFYCVLRDFTGFLWNINDERLILGFSYVPLRPAAIAWMLGTTLTAVFVTLHMIWTRFTANLRIER